jgi:putative colanic acid biosynthesis UDP-glucose lipid carrier transferase
MGLPDNRQPFLKNSRFKMKIKCKKSRRNERLLFASLSSPRRFLYVFDLGKLQSNIIMKKVLSRDDKNNIASVTISEGNNLIKTDRVLPVFNTDNYLSQILNFKKNSGVSLLSLPLELKINWIIKRSIDLFLSTIFIVVILSWLTLVIGILIKSDSKGPVFFLQKRNKKNGRIFTCIKFRSMIVNEEADRVQARENDQRITRVGKFLRKYYLDELPQFINVLFGHMSVIGPRPHMITDNLKYQDLIGNYSFRSNVKPGITGLAQISGYNGPITDIVKMKTRVKIDNFYIRHWSLKLDAVILFRMMLKAIRCFIKI